MQTLLKQGLKNGRDGQRSLRSERRGCAKVQSPEWLQHPVRGWTSESSQERMGSLGKPSAPVCLVGSRKGFGQDRNR